MSKAAVGEELFKAADHLSQKPRSSSPARRGPTSARRRLEIDVKGVEVVGASRLPDHPEGARRRLPARSPPPVDPQRAAASHLRIRHEIINAVRDFFNNRGFILADTPIFTPAA
jgi:asparaginyl-tRNA synthetase